MNEKLLQYLWKFQYFNKGELCSTAGEPIEIIDCGQLNHNQGPDFLNARIRVADTIWVGNVELHVLSSHWNLHQHGVDSNYQNIVLHVVWQHDIEVN